MKKHKSVILFSEWKKPLQALNLEQKGRILDALLDFPDGVQPDFDDPLLLMAWAFMQGGLEENARKWDEIRERRAEAGRRGAEVTNARKHANQQSTANPANADFVRQNQQSTANPAVSVSGSVSDSVSGSGSDSAKEISPDGDTEKAADVDADLAQIVQHYEQAVGSFPRSALDKLQAWRKSYSTEMILLAIDKAAEAGKRSWSYINGILSGWQRDGLRTPGDVAAADARRATQKANAPRNKAMMASRPPEEAAAAGNFLANAAHRRPLKKKGEHNATVQSDP